MNSLDALILGLELIPHLMELNLCGTVVSSVTNLSSCTALRRLNVSYCTQLSDAGLLGLDQIPTLEELNLVNTPVKSAPQLVRRRKLL
jgi:hypothetical protein